MEKFIFLATIKDRLTEMELPEEIINQHVKIFEDCFKGKGADEVDKVIDGAGGIEEILKSIYNLEVAKKNADNAKDSPKKADTEAVSETDDNISDFPENKKAPDEEALFDESSNDMTKEMPKAPDIDVHIREAEEELSDTMEKTAVNNVVSSKDNVEFSAEFSDYDFETLFAEKLSKPEIWVNNLREKLSKQKYRSTLPLAILVDALIFIIVSALFPVLIVSAVVFALAYVATLVAGLCFAVIPIGYGIYMLFKSVPIGLYELGIGITSLGVTMILSILLYNYVRRLVPFLFKQLKKLFMLCIRITKKYFGKTVKEEN